MVLYTLSSEDLRGSLSNLWTIDLIQSFFPESANFTLLKPLSDMR